MSQDFAHYLHLHRVRTLIHILTPYLEAGIPLSPAVYLQQFRDHPGSTHLACDERPAGGGCLPLAIEGAAFDRMSNQQIYEIDADLRLCLRRYYGDRLHERRRTTH